MLQFIYNVINTKTIVPVLSCCLSFVYFPLDTEWKSELINSRHFDKEIGHQNPRYQTNSSFSPP